VARVTYGVAPDSIQGAVAAGLLGAGSVVLGSMEECGRLLTEVSTATRAGEPLETAVGRIIADHRASGRRIPGVGHAIHTEGDPRAPRLLEVAEACGRRGPHTRAMEAVAAAASADAGRPLPMNITGAVAAVLLELGVPWQLHRGFALISRSAGLVAHIGEELDAPITPGLRRLVRAETEAAPRPADSTADTEAGATR
jgi:citrate synthase